MSIRLANIFFLLAIIIMTLVVSQIYSFGDILEGLDSKIPYLPDKFEPNNYSNFNSRYKDG